MKKWLCILLLGMMALCLTLGAATASAEPESYTISAEAFPAEGGYVSGANTYGWQSSVSLWAVARDGYRFVCWKEDGSVISQDANYVFRATENRHLTAVFAAANTMVTLYPGSNASGSIVTLSTGSAPIALSQAAAENGQFYLDSSNQIAFRLDDNYCPATLFQANEGYAFDGWTKEKNGSDTSYTASWKDMDLRWWLYETATDNSKCRLTGLTGSPRLYGEVYIPKTLNGIPVTEIVMSFQDFDNLETIYFHKDTLIDEMPEVMNCSKLKNICLIDDQGIVVRECCLPASIKTIRYRTFANSSIETLTLPGVTLVEGSITGAFENCDNLSSLVFEQAAAIPSGAFSKISSTCTVTYPGPMSSLPWDAASYSPGLVFRCTDGTCGWCGDGWRSGMTAYDGSCMHWTMDSSGNMTVDSFGSAEDLFEGHRTAQIVRAGNWDKAKLKTLTVNHAYGINMKAFSGCADLMRVSLPNSVTSIGQQAFESCGALRDLYFYGSGAQWNNVSKHITWNSYVSSDFQVHWRCGVTFIANGHGTAPAAQTDLWSNESIITDPGSLSSGNLIFLGWFADADCTQAWDFNTPIPGDMTLYAGWDTVKYQVNLVIRDDDGATVSGAGRYEEGAVVTLSAQPSEGHYLKDWTPAYDFVHDLITITDGQFIMPAWDVNIVAHFGLLYDVHLAVFPEDCGTAAASPTAAPANSQVTLSATPNSGYHFREWRIVPDDIAIENDQFTMPAEAVTVTAVFIGETPYRISSDGAAVAVVDDGWLCSVATQAVHGEDVSLNLSEDAVPQEGCYFTGEFTVDGVSLGREYDENHVNSWPITDFTMPKHDVSIAAVQAQRESLLLDFTQSSALSIDYMAWVQLQIHHGLAIILTDDGDEFIDLDNSGTFDLAVTEPDWETTADYTLTLLPDADAAGCFTFTFDGVEERFGRIALMTGVPPFGSAAFTLPAALTTIEEGAFEGDTGLTAVDASACTSIGAEAFKDCTGLTQIRLHENCRIDSTAFSGCGTVFVYAPAGGDTENWCSGRTGFVFVEEVQIGTW